MRQLYNRLSYANVVATIALFVALGGGAYAASQLPKDSVGTRQLKNDSVTGAKVKDGSLAGTDIDTKTIGLVSNATHATSADSASHAALADHAVSAGESANSAKLGGHSPNDFITPLLGHVQDVGEATTKQTSWGAVSGLSNASPNAKEVEMVTPYYSALYASGFTVYSFYPIGGGGHVDIRLIVNGEGSELVCIFGTPLQGHCINPPSSYVKVPGGSTLAIRIHEEPDGGPGPETIPAFSFQASVQLSTTPP